MKHFDLKKPNARISLLGLGTLVLPVLLWLAGAPRVSVWGKLAALLSAGLFGGVFLRFVPSWLSFWSIGEDAGTPLPPPPEEPKRMPLRCALLFLLADALILLLVPLIRALCSLDTPLSFWLGTDAQHYIAIARDWYLSEGEWDRLVELVFLPGYPLLVRLVHLLVGNWTAAGLLSSAICFSASGAVLYRLLRMDLDHRETMRALCFLLLTPGAFFLAAPMSESLFLLLSALCLYEARRGRWPAAGLFGALAAFTRSLGLLLTVPLFFEAVSAWRGGSRRAAALCSILLVPLGFGAYCLINASVSGNALQFAEYQRVHWHQELSFFFNTAAYQLDNAIGAARGGQLPLLLGLWLPNLIASFGALSLMLFGVRRLRASYSAWFLAYFVIAIGPTWLLSAPRYLLVLLPLPMALAKLSDRAGRALILSLLTADAALYYLIAYALRMQVW